MAIITIGEDKYESLPGERLSELLIRVGRGIPMPCGGRGTCGKCRVLVDGREVSACRYVVRTDARVILPEKEKIESEVGAVPAVGSGGEGRPDALSLDVGTTTLALAAVSTEEKRILRAVTAVNPQRAFGADVMSRIAFCRGNGPAQLQKCLIGAVNEMLRDPALGLPEAGSGGSGLPMYVSGNTTMLHLFFGVDCSAMGAAPYTPAFLGERTSDGESLGLNGVGKVVSLPGAAAFVGADIIAGLNCVGLPPGGKYRLLIDLGTNAEVVLFSAEGGVCTAAAAGPCFEGANISCGMSASEGAVCAYSNGVCATIGGAPAKGICGTGLVDVVAFLLDTGELDETGYMENGGFTVAEGVTLTQADARQFQLAKSAIRSAADTLIARQKTAYGDIDRLFISGGFSAKINVDNAVETGLLPPELADRCVPINNSSLLGTVKYACEGNDLSVYLKNLRYVDLSADPLFSEAFMENMAFD
ncbi:MAG: ASKHA domain-containing protein [Clostridiales bacterium]|nr:ASKHA domain-containing protein [Clostridiales bacterium]